MILIRLIELLWPVIYLAGIIVTTKYFRKHGKPVLILLLMYFTVGLYSCTLAKPVNRFIRSKFPPNIPQEQVEKYRAYQADVNAVQAKHFGATAVHTEAIVKNVTLPLGQILLVSSLFFLGKRMNSREPNQKADPISKGSNANL